MNNYYYIFIILGSFLLGLKLKCKSKCFNCECELDKKETEDGSVLREVKIFRKTKS